MLLALSALDKQQNTENRDLGTLVSDAQALRIRLTQERGPNVPGPSALTTAELRVLPLLATHLSFREIGAELFLSKHTVKSQAISVYANWPRPTAVRQSSAPEG